MGEGRGGSDQIGSLCSQWPTYSALWVAHNFGTDPRCRARGRCPRPAPQRLSSPTASPCRNNFYGQRMYVRNESVTHIIFFNCQLKSSPTPRRLCLLRASHDGPPRPPLRFPVRPHCMSPICLCYIIPTHELLISNIYLRTTVDCKQDNAHIFKR